MPGSMNQVPWRRKRSSVSARGREETGATGLPAPAGGRVPCLLMAVPVAISLLYVHRYGVNAPYNDGVTLIPLLEKLLAGELGWGDLYAQHNEHRIFFPRLALLLLGLATGFNDVAAMYAIQVFLLITMVALLIVFRRTVSANPWLFVPVPFLIFNLGQSWNLLQGFQLTLVFVQTFTVLSFALIHLCPDGRRGVPFFLGALASGVLATFSSAPGLLVWPLGLLQLLLHSAGSRPRKVLAGLWGLAGALSWALYLRGYESAETTSWRYSLNHPQESAEYLVSALGASLFHGNLDLAFSGGLLLVFLAAAGLLLSLKRRRLRADSFWLAALTFALLTLAATTIARGMMPEDALNPKYATYSVLAPVSIYAILAGSLRGRSGLSLTPIWTLCALVVAGVVLSYPQGIAEAREIEAKKSKTAFVLATHESQPDEALAGSGVFRERFRTDPEDSRRWASFLERRGYSVFSGGTPALPEPLPDSSPESPDVERGAGAAGAAQARLMVPTNGGGRFVLVSGWAASRGGEVEGVYVVVDGRPYPAFHGARREVLAESTGSPGHEYAGFERAIPTAELGPGRHELSVMVTTDAGESRLDIGGRERLTFELE